MSLVRDDDGDERGKDLIVLDLGGSLVLRRALEDPLLGALRLALFSVIWAALEARPDEPDAAASELAQRAKAFMGMADVSEAIDREIADALASFKSEDSDADE